MKQKLTGIIKKQGPKAVVFLLMAALVLVLTFLSPVPGAYAAYDDTNYATAHKSGDNADATNGGPDGKLPSTLSEGQGWAAPRASSGTISDTTPVNVPVNNVIDAGVQGAADKPDAGGLGDNDNLPQAGGITASTLIGLFGLSLVSTGGSIFTILRKKNHGKSEQ